LTLPNASATTLAVHPAAIAFLIIAGYLLALGWLLRRETAWTFSALIALCAVSLALRLVLTGAYPWGLNEDEPKNLACSVEALQQGALYGESCNGPPYLLSALFAAPLVPHLGFNRWSMRLYSTVTGVLATPAAFGVARAMGLAVGPSLAAAGLVAVLPWSVYFGRISLGGELTFHQLLLLAGLAALVWTRGGLFDTLIAAFGLCLLLWDYLAARSMMGMPLVAAVLAPGWRRLWCLAVIPLALLGWYPHLLAGSPHASLGFSFQSFGPGFDTAPLDTLIQRSELALRTFVWPVGNDGVFTMRAVAVHPVFVLALAGIGLFTGVRRFLFLLAGFVAGMLPGIVSYGWGISGHRIMMAYPFISLAAACSLNVLPWRWLRWTAVAAVVLVAGAWSTEAYFSRRFWPQELRVDDERTALSETVAENPPERIITMVQNGYYGPPPAPGAVAEPLNVDNFLPRDNEAATYAFTWQAAPLRSQYDRFFPGRVQPVGLRSFLVRFEAANWSWLRKYGFLYQVRCTEMVRTAVVPFLYTLSMGVPELRCSGPMTHIWRAHWHGPATEMSLFFNHRIAVEAGPVSLQKDGFEQTLQFQMPADVDFTVRNTTPPGDPWPRVALTETWPAGGRVPPWEWFSPVWPADMVAASP